MDEAFEWELVGRAAEGAKRLDRGGSFGVAGDDEQFDLVMGLEPSGDFEPAIEGPVFTRGAAARVDCDTAGRKRVSSYGESVENSGGGDAEEAKRPAKMGGGGSAGRMGGGAKKSLRGMEWEVVSEVGVRVGPEIYDSIEAREPRGEIGCECVTLVEGGPTGFVLGVSGIDQAAGEGQCGGGAIAGEFDACSRRMVAKRRERGEGDDKITERTASKNEDAAHRRLERWAVGRR